MDLIDESEHRVMEFTYGIIKKLHCKVWGECGWLTNNIIAETEKKNKMALCFCSRELMSFKSPMCSFL